MLTKVAAKGTGMVGVNWCDCLPGLTLHRPLARLSRLAGRKMERIVAVVDDDESVRESLPDLLREFGLTASAFASAQEFLAHGHIALRIRTVLHILDFPLWASARRRAVVEIRQLCIDDTCRVRIRCCGCDAKNHFLQGRAIRLRNPAMCSGQQGLKCFGIEPI